MIMARRIIDWTYWKNLNSGMIYKYERGTKPLNATTEWRQVTQYEYDQQINRLANLYEKC